MNKPKSSRKKASLFTAIALAALILGIGCISLALLNIGRSAILFASFADLYIDNTTSPPMSSVNLNGLTDEEGGIAEVNDQLPVALPSPALYQVHPAQGDKIGILAIPALNLVLPVFHGTEEDELAKGVGHFMQSVLPGATDNSVLSGHRDTVFRNLGKIKIGDQVTVKTSAGTFTYEVKGTRIVDKEDRTVIVPTDRAVLTLTTCYPFAFIGNAPDRFIVSADLITSDYSRTFQK